MVQYAIAGRTRRITLGSPVTLDPGQAREAAKDLLARVRLGGDPASDKQRTRQQAAETVGALLPYFLARQRARQKPRSYVETERHLLRYAQSLHSTPIAALDRRTIATRLNELAAASGPAAANRLRASLSAFCTWAASEGYLDANPVSFTNKAPENGARTHVPSDDDIAAIWKALGDDGYGAVLKLIILTGTRRGEIGGLRWSEIDREHTTITLPPARTKNGREHIVPLSTPARAILAALPRRLERDGTPRDLVFGHGPHGFVDWGDSKQNIDARITVMREGKPLTHWTPHDFRRKLSTVMHETLNVPPHVVEAILGHVSGHKAGVAGIYNQALYLGERRRALERWGEHVLAIVTGQPVPGQVVKLRG